MNKKATFSILISFLLLIPLTTILGVTLENPIGAENFGQLVDRIIDIFFTLALYVTPLMIVIAGLLFVTAAGNPNQVQTETAKNILLYSLIGFLIILVAKGIVELFIEVLTK